MPWLVFLGSAAVIVLAGTKLSRYGDELAGLTGLGGLWIGVVLMAGATSLPEMLTAMSAAWINAPDLAAGDLFGAVMSNMLTLGIIDMLHRDKRVWQQAAFEHTMVAALATGLVALAALSLVLRPAVSVGHVGVDVCLLLLVYVLGMRLVYRQEDVRRRQKERERVVEQQAPDPAPRRIAVRRAAFGFARASLALLVVCPFFAASAKELAVMTGLSTTFFGTSLVAITTSLPELVTSLAAVRLGAFDLAVGNLFGSNAFNMGLLFFADLAYRPGPLLNAVDRAHAATALVGILLMNIGLMGIIYRAEKRYWLIEPDSALIVLGYLAGMGLLFRLYGG